MTIEITGCAASHDERRETLGVAPPNPVQPLRVRRVAHLRVEVDAFALTQAVNQPQFPSAALVVRTSAFISPPFFL